jgi:hypothetical protein
MYESSTTYASFFRSRNGGRFAIGVKTTQAASARLLIVNLLKSIHLLGGIRRVISVTSLRHS